MSSYIFPGYPAFLDDAASELGRPESADPARRIETLAALANLCAQAVHGDPAHVRGILAKAAEFRDQLATALRAAELMMAAVEAARPTPEPEPEPEPGPEAEVNPGLPEPAAAEEGPETPRDPT